MGMFDNEWPPNLHKIHLTPPDKTTNVTVIMTSLHVADLFMISSAHHDMTTRGTLIMVLLVTWDAWGTGILNQTGSKTSRLCATYHAHMHLSLARGTQGCDVIWRHSFNGGIWDWTIYFNIQYILQLFMSYVCDYDIIAPKLPTLLRI